MIKETRDKCINCNLCNRNCYFLNKHNINLKDFTYRPDLRYHCFLCNKCQNVCPKDLSGKEISMEMRREDIRGALDEKKIRDPYIYKNDGFSKSEDLIYFGCSFPGYYPKTSQKLIEIGKKLGVDYDIDCCKFTINLLGEDQDLTSMDDYFYEKGVKRLICVCPNCYHFLKAKLKKTKVISIFKFLYDNNIGKKLDKKIEVYFPCSDRYNREIFGDIEKFLENGFIDQYKDINCCGLGGAALSNEKDIKGYIKEKMENAQEDSIYTYCASCSYQFSSYGLKNIRHILSEILGVEEKVCMDYGKNLVKFHELARN